MAVTVIVYSLQLTPRRREREPPPNTGLGLKRSSFEYRVFCRCFSSAVRASVSVKQKNHVHI